MSVPVEPVARAELELRAIPGDRKATRGGLSVLSQFRNFPPYGDSPVQTRSLALFRRAEGAAIC